MIVYLYPADLQGCGTYRMILPGEALRMAGHEVRVIPPSLETGLGGDVDQNTGQVMRVDFPPDADVIVLQRVVSATLVQAIPLLRKQGVAVVVDMDDDLTRIDPNNPAFAGLHPRGGNRANVSWHTATQACLNATMVTVSTDSLLSTYAPHGRGAVLRNCIPARFLQLPRVDSDIISWPGSIHSHPGDLTEVGPAVARLVREGFEYRATGPEEGIRAAFGIDAGADIDSTGSVEIFEWPMALSSIGVGLAPLADTSFNRSKSWLKPLEMSAVGVPWVASPRPEYLRLQKIAGAGLMASRPKDWHQLLKRFATSTALRAEHSGRGRQTAAAQTIEGNAWRWLEVWDQARRMEQRNRSPLGIRG